MELTRAQALALGYALSMWGQACSCDARLTVTLGDDGDGFGLAFHHEKGCRAVLRANAARN